MNKRLLATALQLAGVLPICQPKPTSCQGCLYQTEEWRDGGHCYFFKNKAGPCAKFEQAGPSCAPIMAKT